MSLSLSLPHRLLQTFKVHRGNQHIVSIVLSLSLFSASPSALLTFRSSKSSCILYIHLCLSRPLGLFVSRFHLVINPIIPPPRSSYISRPTYPSTFIGIPIRCFSFSIVISLWFEDFPQYLSLKYRYLFLSDLVMAQVLHACIEQLV